MLLILLSLACEQTTPVEADLADAYAEVILDQPVTATAPLSDLRILVSTTDTLQIVDRRESSPSDLELDATLFAAAELGGELLIATDRGLFTGSVAPRLTQLDDLLDAPPTELLVRDDALWLADEGHVWQWSDGALDEWTLQGPMAKSGDSLWTRSDDQLVELADDEELQRLDLVPEQLVVDSEQTLWILGDGLRSRSADGGMTRWELDGALQILGHPDAAEIWVRTELDVLRHVDGEWLALGAPLDAEGCSVDALGRLLCGVDDTLLQISHGRPLGLAGLGEGAALVADATLTLLPTGPINEAAVQVDGVELELDESLSAIVSVDDWFDGAEHTLSAWVTTSQGEREEATRRFTVSSPGTASWTEHIQPLYQSRCSACHGGSSETELDTPEAWEGRIDTILDMVETEQMPIGSEPLDATELALIRAWRDQGFPE